MTKAITRKEMQEARDILKPVLKAEKKLHKAATALIVAKLALAHALIETDVDSNPALATWTEGVLNGDETVVQAVYAALKKKKSKSKRSR